MIEKNGGAKPCGYFSEGCPKPREQIDKRLLSWEGGGCVSGSARSQWAWKGQCEQERGGCRGLRGAGAPARGLRVCEDLGFCADDKGSPGRFHPWGNKVQYVLKCITGAVVLRVTYKMTKLK